MRSLVVYDSNYGNTQKIAEIIAEGLGCDAFRISELEPSQLSDYDLLVVGTPINGWRPTVGMEEFLSKLKKRQLDGIKATTFDTRVKLFIHGDAMGKLAHALEDSGAEIIVDPMPFYVGGRQEEPYLLDGEIEKARDWAGKIWAAAEL